MEEGTAIGRALGLEEGIKEGAQSAALEIASLQKRLADTLEQSNGIATQSLLATQTAAGFVVELQRERNLVAAQTVELATLKRINEEKTVELATLKRINEDKERELEALRSSQAAWLGLSSSASATRPTHSAYFRRPQP